MWSFFSNGHILDLDLSKLYEAKMYRYSMCKSAVGRFCERIGFIFIDELKSQNDR